jgi:hypothetical protein
LDRGSKHEQKKCFFLRTMNKNNVEGKHDDCMNHGNRKHTAQSVLSSLSHEEADAERTSQMFDMPLTESASGLLSEQN